MSYIIQAKTVHTAVLHLRVVSIEGGNAKNTLNSLQRAVNEVTAKYNISANIIHLKRDVELEVRFISERKREFVENAAHQLIEWLLYRRDLAGA